MALFCTIQYRRCEMRNRNCCYLTGCHSWESELFNRDHSNDPSPCNASQQDTLLLVTAHPSLRQLLSISTSSALQTPGPQSYLPTTHNRSCSEIRDFVCRFVAQLQYTLRGHFRLEVNRIAVRPPGLHILRLSPSPSPTPLCYLTKLMIAQFRSFNVIFPLSPFILRPGLERPHKLLK